MFEEVISLIQSLPIEWQHMLQWFYMIDQSPAEVLKVKEILDELSDEDRSQVLNASITQTSVDPGIDVVGDVGSWEWVLPPVVE